MVKIISPGSWVGNVWGTHAGLLFADVQINGDETSIELRANVDGDVHLFAGLLLEEGGVYSARLRTPANAPIQSEVTLVFQGIDNDSLEGRWFQPNLAAGIFRLDRPGSRAVRQSAATDEPIQIIQRTGQLPRVTIFRNDLKRLVQVMKEVLPVQNEVVLDASWSNSTVKRLAPTFWDNPLLPDEAESISLSLTESIDGIARTINISFGPKDGSFWVSGANRVWVEGAYVQLDETLGSLHSRWRGWFERHGLNINGAALLSVLAILPSLDLPSRSVLLVVTLVALLAIKWLHSATTRLRIYLLHDRQKTRLFDWTDLGTLFVGTAVLALIPIFYTWLKDEGLTRFFEWLALATS